MQVFIFIVVVIIAYFLGLAMGYISRQIDEDEADVAGKLFIFDTEENPYVYASFDAESIESIKERDTVTLTVVNGASQK